MPLPDVIHRAELPIDDRPHGIDLTGDILHAAIRRPGAVDVWYLARRDPSVEHMRRSFQIVATGQPIPLWLGRHHATAITQDGQLVWHVLENFCPHRAPDVGQLFGNQVRSIPCPACSVILVRTAEHDWNPD
jgi:hypothetical protein